MFEHIPADRIPFTNAGQMVGWRRQLRRAQITGEMDRVARAAQARLAAEVRRPLIPVPSDQEGTVLSAVAAPPTRYLPEGACAHAISVGGAWQRTAGPSWAQRLRIAAVLAIGLPAAIGAAYVVATAVIALGDLLGRWLA